MTATASTSLPTRGLYMAESSSGCCGRYQLPSKQPSMCKWSHSAPLLDDMDGTHGAGAVAINGAMLVAGGGYRICAQYVPNTNTWTKMSGTNLKHNYGCVIVHDDNVLVLGGAVGGRKLSKTVEEFDRDTKRWNMSDMELPVGLWIHHAVLLHLP